MNNLKPITRTEHFMSRAAGNPGAEKLTPITRDEKFLEDIAEAIESGGGGESTIAWKPTVSADGIISWTRTSSTTKPADQNIKGEDGAEGFSPTVTITPIHGGNRVTITDSAGNHEFDVMNGSGSGSGNADFDITPEHNIAATSANGEHLIFDFTEANTLTARASIPGSWEKEKILATKDYVDTEVAKKQNRLTYNNDFTFTATNANAGGASVDAILPDVGYFNGKLGMNLAVGKEKWVGTYTDENDVVYQVYSIQIYIPALPATAGITTYEHGVSNIKQILNICGFTTDGFVLNAPRQNAQDNITIYQASKSESNKTFSIEVGKDRSSKKAYVTMVYAKNN